MLHDRLWEMNVDLTRQCREHGFVRQLADGTLDRDEFRRYVAQDAFFLRGFLRAYALAIAKCSELDHARQLHELMSGVLDELRLHARYAAELDIDLLHVTPYAATSAYTDFLLRVAWQASLGDIMAAMVPCMRLYCYLGEELAAGQHAVHPYKDWITTYSSDEFRQLACRLEHLLDAVATDNSAVRNLYRYALECELAFFSAPGEETSCKSP